MTKSRSYMKGAEFKARQGWLPFVDAVGIMLEVLEPVKAAAWTWFKQWKKGIITKAPVTVGHSVRQLELFYWAGRETPGLF